MFTPECNPIQRSSPLGDFDPQANDSRNSLVLDMPSTDEAAPDQAHDASKRSIKGQKGFHEIIIAACFRARDRAVGLEKQGAHP